MNSIVDYLKSIGKPSDYASRAQMARQMGITNYTGSAAQNTQMLQSLRSGSTKTTPTVTTPTVTTPSVTAPTPKVDTSSTAYTGTGLTESDINSKLSALGIDTATAQSMSPAQKATLAAIGDVATSTYSTAGKGITLNDALTAAAQDPNIIAKYSDALKIDQAEFANNITQLQTAVTATAEGQSAEFLAQKKATDEAAAQAGQAYSGFREQAKEKLATEQGGIITSTRSALQDKLRSLGTGYEAKYGTGATPSGGVQYRNPITGETETIGTQTIGGITGTQPGAKAADITSRATDLYNVGQLPKL